MISLDNLTVSYGGWTLFDNISFLINPKDRIGLVGRNGAGKTTLLRIITGEQQPTSGHVTLNGECTIGYLPQTMRVADTTTLAEETAKAFDEVLRLEAEIASLTREIAERTDYESAGYEQLLHRLNDAQDHYHILGGDTREADIEKTLLGLGFKRTDFGRATSEFSGGWRMRIELAKLLLRRPSIFLLDGGQGHVNTIAPVISGFGLHIPVFGMVKDQKHRTRAISSAGGEISLSANRSAFHLLTQIQDEVHRYSVAYMHSIHVKSSYQMELTKVRGIGEKKAQKLLLRFKTLVNLKQATLEELETTAGINRTTAEELYGVIQEMTGGNPTG